MRSHKCANCVVTPPPHPPPLKKKFIDGPLFFPSPTLHLTDLPSESPACLFVVLVFGLSGSAPSLFVSLIAQVWGFSTPLIAICNPSCGGWWEHGLCRSHRAVGFRAERAVGFRAERAAGFRTERAAGFRTERAAGFRAERAVGFRTERAAGFRTERAPGQN